MEDGAGTGGVSRPGAVRGGISDQATGRRLERHGRVSVSVMW
jgi:hypothetical protein